MKDYTRRQFLQQSTGFAIAAGTSGSLFTGELGANERQSGKMSFGLVTYLWGRDWDLPTLLANCQTANALGVELRTTHAHGVEPSLSKGERDEVKKRFADSPVTLAGIGSNERFDNPDPQILKKAIADSKEFIKLSHDVGSSGVKVKPDRFYEDVPREKTIAQIARSLNELGSFADEFDQQVRLEVHGQCAPLPIIKQIIDQADHKRVALCWNSNVQDLDGEGLDHNFNLVKNRLGETCHVRQLDDEKYPYQQLFRLLKKTDYRGWILLEASGNPTDRVTELAKQRKLFDELMGKA